MIDNSLPIIRDFKSTRERTRLKVTFSAVDSLSYIKEASYLIRPDEWRSIFPADGICDSQQEHFILTLPVPAKSDNLITVKVKDRHGNIGVYKYAF